MGVSAAAAKQSARSRGSHAVAAYSTAVEPATRVLVLAACATLFLDSAGTVQLIYTVRPSFVLMGLAVGVGLPLAWRGWRSAPWWISWSAAGLVAVYVICVLVDPGTTADVARAGSHRDLAYLADLVVGVGSIGLVNALWGDGRRVRSLLAALLLAGAAAAAYAVYQWPAQILGWPFDDVLTVADSSATTSGAFQGGGLLGYERVRGTFLEPHFLAAFLASILPLSVAVGVCVARTRWRVGCAVGAALMLLALLFTASVPAWAILLVCSLGVGVWLAIGRGLVIAARVAAALFVTALIAVPVTTAYPVVLSGITGRSSVDLAFTSHFRTDTWHEAIDVWSRRPVAGYGPGQSSVQLTLRAAGGQGPGLLSAQGVWAAALIDSGVVGLGFWLLLLGGILGHGFTCIARRPTVRQAAVALAALVAVAGALVSGDRLELRVWILLAAVVAVSAPGRRETTARAGSD